MSTEQICPLCNRPLAEPIVSHYLIPLSKGGKNTPTIELHKMCQEKINATFELMEQKRYYHTIERIMENEDIQKFVKWLKNKDPEFYERPAKTKR